MRLIRRNFEILYFYRNIPETSYLFDFISRAFEGIYICYFDIHIINVKGENRFSDLIEYEYVLIFEEKQNGKTMNEMVSLVVSFYYMKFKV